MKSRTECVVVVGCLLTLARFTQAATAVGASPPTFNRDIAPIIWNNCAACHHAGEVAPFNLTSYEDVRKRAKQVAKITHARTMPPWKAEPGYGEFEGERRLSDAQIATIQAWAEAGAPEGNAADLPALPKFSEGWQLGQPDIVVQMVEPYTVRAERPDIFRCFVVPFNIPAGKYVKAVDYRPSNRKITHHALLFLDNTGMARKLDEADPGPGYSRMGGVGFLPSGGMGGWAPGAAPHRFPDHAARAVGANTDLVIQTHFHPSGKVETEQASVGIYLTDEAPKRTAATVPLGVRSTIDIPPGARDYKWADSITLPVAVEIPAITPHAHYICKDMQVWATLPTGEKRWLIWIKDWDFDWQGQYRYKAPVELPAGTKIDMVYTYDNSADNPRNPSSPPQRVRRGEQTTDEMGITFLSVMPKNPSDIKSVREAIRDHFLNLRGGAAAEGSTGSGLGALLGRLRGSTTPVPTTQAVK
ncbi:MAG: Calcium-binding EF-hand-containing protein [Phycisphaerales bacterium]|nr:Calcium-binding EF-hand-containing protein [Phycisphaerales bacterium]